MKKIICLVVCVILGMGLFSDADQIQAIDREEELVSFDEIFPPDYDVFVIKIAELKEAFPESSPSEILGMYEKKFLPKRRKRSVYSAWYTLTSAEKLLVATSPSNAIITKKLSEDAFQRTTNLFGKNGLGDKSDAFRHAYWNATMTLYIDRMWAKAYSDAHEDRSTVGYEADGYLKSAHKRMDLHNNEQGRNVISWQDFPLFVSKEAVVERVRKILTNNAKTGCYWLHD